MNLIAAHTKDKWFHVGIQLKIDSATLTSYENQHGDLNAVPVHKAM